MTLLNLTQLQEKLFSERDWSNEEWPELIEIEYSEDSDLFHNTVEITCFIPKTLSWFEGHYPDQPVLPGVVQTYWVTELSQILFRISNFQGINALKFINMIMPATQLKLVLKFNKETHSVAFTYFNESGAEAIKCSTGKAIFAK